jgi:hypothetical protein
MLRSVQLENAFFDDVYQDWAGGSVSEVTNASSRRRRTEEDPIGDYWRP